MGLYRLIRSRNLELRLFLQGVMIWWMAALALLGGTLSADAHGGGTPQLTDEPVGPYRLFVWSQPDPPLVGDLHFTIAVLQPPTDDNGNQPGDPVVGADVRIELQPVSADGKAVSGMATHDKAVNKLMYETDLRVPAAGGWQVIVRVDGREGTGSASYPVQVEPARALNWPMMGAGALALLLVLGAVGLRRSRQQAS